MFKLPYFHYTHFNNLVKIFRTGQIRSRAWLSENTNDFNDVSIDPEQSRRAELELLEYVPIFPGYYKKYYRGEKLDGYLQEHYDRPTIYNRSFYGSLNKTLRTKIEVSYEKIVLLLLNHDNIIEYANKGYVRYFTNIAIKDEADEMDCFSAEDLMDNLSGCMGENGHLYCEIDVLDDGEKCFIIPDDIEAIIVDNDEIKKLFLNELRKFLSKDIINNLRIITASLPRDD